MDHEDVRRWVASYESAWRTSGITDLPGLFTEDASYRPSPWAPAVEGMDAICDFWEAEREGADEVFAMTFEVVAVEDDTAVVRAQVDYERSDSGRWRDLWVLRFAVDGRCRAFEEWPFAPGQDDDH